MWLWREAASVATRAYGAPSAGIEPATHGLGNHCPIGAFVLVRAGASGWSGGPVPRWPRRPLVETGLQLPATMVLDHGVFVETALLSGVQ